jgi:hypothetical protein
MLRGERCSGNWNTKPDGMAEAILHSIGSFRPQNFVALVVIFSSSSQCQFVSGIVQVVQPITIEISMPQSISVLQSHTCLLPSRTLGKLRP